MVISGNGGDQRQSGISNSVHLFGKAFGVIAAILLTPKIFLPMRGGIYQELQAMWGDGLAGLLTWVVGAAEAVVIYAGTALLVASLVTFGLARFAAKRFMAGAR